MLHALEEGGGMKVCFACTEVHVRVWTGVGMCLQKVWGKCGLSMRVCTACIAECVSAKLHECMGG